MSKANIIRAWKNEAYRLSLSALERAVLPANPAGVIELGDSQLDEVAGGYFTHLHPCFTENVACRVC
jgi:mersacidin/lichenicidin family type 2 lantibiotic